MGYTYTGDALLRASFEVMVPQPLDNRTVVNSEQDLYTIPESSAYRGMTVSNPDDGNIYMLTDTSKIKSRDGWKSSGISIITCSQDEYQALLENTNLEDFTPIDSDKDYLRRDSYYYIPEEGDGTYLTAEWGKSIEAQLATKAAKVETAEIVTNLNALAQKLAYEYTTTENLQKTYATIESVYTTEQADEKFLTKEDAATTYAIQESLDTLEKTLTSDYVTWEAIGNPDIEGDDFAFVTQEQYAQDKEANTKEIDTQLVKTDKIQTQELSIQKIEEKEVVQGEETIIEEQVVSDVLLTTEENKLLLNGKQIALNEEIPVIECMSQEKYNDKKEKNELDSKTYYYTYENTENPSNGYVTKEYIDSIVVLRSDIQKLIFEAVQPLSDKIIELENRIKELETESSKLDLGTLNNMKLG